MKPSEMYLEYKKMSGEIRLDIELTDTEVVESKLQNQASISNKDGTCDQLTTADAKLLGELQEKAKKINSIEEIRQEVLPSERNMAQIQRIPEFIFRNVNVEEYFRPKVLSIGPIFADDRSLVIEKELKLQLAAHYLPKTDTSEAMLKEIKVNMKDMKKYFDEEVLKRYSDDEELTRLLFLDGCAMLGFIHGFLNRTLNELNISNDQAALINQDLLLPENQIPFTVLEVLIGIGRPWENLESVNYLIGFIFHIIGIAFPFVHVDRLISSVLDCFFSSKKKDQQPVHILGLLRNLILLDNNSLFHDFFCNSCCGSAALIRYMMECFNKSDRFFTRLRNSVPTCTVQDLKKAGIKFKPGSSLTTISFHSRLFIRPKFTLPKLVLDESTERYLLNLVADEMCFPKSHPTQKLWVTSYVKLLDQLIENEQDFKDLKAADILQNNLGSDTEAFRFIKSIASKCFPVPPDKDLYADMKNEINNYCRTRCAIWMGEVRNAHFRNPCTTLAFLATAILLVLTAVQTWYAVHPNK